MRLAWTLPICLVVVAVAALAGPGWFGGARERHKGHEPGSGAPPRTYYVDAARGRDSNPGKAADAPFRTLTPFNRIPLRGGDAILLHGGQRFSGSLHLGTGNLSSTSSSRMLRIGSYGGGRATVAAPPRRDAISAVDIAGIRISGLNLVGRSPRCLKDRSGNRYGGSGIRVESDRADASMEQGISVDQVDASGFCNGIAVGSQADGGRISHLHLTAVRAHDNLSAGIWTYDLVDLRHAIGDVRIDRSSTYRNGIRGGIVLFGVDGGTVERSVAFANGRAAGGGVGMWAFDSNRILFAHDESYGNGSPAIDNDGDGFDFDRGVTNSSMVDDHSHDNGGMGFLVCSCNGKAFPYYRIHDITLRSNVSRNDGSSGQPTFWLQAGELMTGIEVVNNRFDSGAGNGPLVWITGCLHCDKRWRASYVAGVPAGQPYTQISLRGNAFIAGGRKRLKVIQRGPRTDLVLQGNHWRRAGPR